MTVASSGCSSFMSEPEPPPSPRPLPRPVLKHTSVTAELCGRELADELAPIEIKLTDATVVDATQFPLYCDRAMPALAWRDVQRIAARSFPTKYAHWLTSTVALATSAAATDVIKMRVRRTRLFDDSLDALSVAPTRFIRSPVRVRFVDEAAVAHDGLEREWFALLTKQLVDPARGVFCCVNERDTAFYLTANAGHDDRHLAAVFAAGRLVGRALLEGGVWGLLLLQRLHAGRTDKGT